MPPEILPEDWHRLRNGEPLGHYELRNLALRAADEFVEHRGPDGSIDNPEYLRVFSLYASQLDKWRTNYDFGVSYLTEGVGSDEHRVARAAAAHVSRLGYWPDRARAIGQLRVKDPFLWNHLKGVEATYKQESIQWAERVEAGREAKSVTGTVGEKETTRTESSGL
jgi:hypothetical protein